MKIVDKWLFNRLKKAAAYEQEQNVKAEKNSMATAMAIDVDRNRIDGNGFNIKVFRANGGTIIETRRYDNKLDRNSNGLYIVTDDKDLGVEIGKIITLEGLKA
jgi:hypothetical protein